MTASQPGTPDSACTGFTRPAAIPRIGDGGNAPRTKFATTADWLAREQREALAPPEECLRAYHGQGTVWRAPLPSTYCLDHDQDDRIKARSSLAKACEDKPSVDDDRSARDAATVDCAGSTRPGGSEFAQCRSEQTGPSWAHSRLIRMRMPHETQAIPWSA